ncbi:MAG: CHC2 zinc finger domain-containing protein [Anaerolineae bacterium]
MTDKKSVSVSLQAPRDTETTENGADCQYSTTVLKTQYQVAVNWLLRGVALVPLQPKSKCIIAGFGAYSEQITTEEQAWFWFQERCCNLAVVTGNGLIVLDFDRRDDYEAWRASWPGLAATYTELTARGAHVFLAGESASGKVGSFEVKGRGAVVMSSPSIHPSGFEYHPLDPGAQIKHVPADFPLLSEHPQVLSKGSTPGYGKDVLTRIKTAYSLLDLAQSLTRLRSGDGRWWHGRCPFHEDKKPSFWVDSKRGLWGCYACNVHGDVINLYAQVHGLAVQEAIKRMAVGLQ